LKAIGVSDRDDQLSDTNPLRIAELRRNQIGRIDSDYRQIRIRIVANQICLTFVTV